MTSSPRVLSLTPPAVLEPTYGTLAATLAPHVLAFAGAGTGAIDAELPAADFVIGDWTHEAKASTRLGCEHAARCLCIFQPTAGVEDIDLGAAATPGSRSPTRRARTTWRSRSGR